MATGSKLAVREFKGGWAVVQGDEVITRTQTKEQATAYMQGLQKEG